MSIIDYVTDFETLGMTADSVVLCCAITKFERDEEKPSEEKLRKNTKFLKLNVIDQIKAGRVVSQDTLDWWTTQPIDLQKEMLSNPDEGLTLDEFVNEIIEFFSDKDEQSTHWCRGMDFDFPLLRSLIRSSNVGKDIDLKLFPIPFWNQRDIRSYISGLTANPSITKITLPDDWEPKSFRAHNPIDDNVMAVLQLKYLEYLVKS